MIIMPKKKRTSRRKIDIDRNIEHFSEEVETLGNKASRKIKESRTKRLYRSGKDRILGGVCGGLAEYFGVDPVLIRFIWIVAVLGWGFGILAYIIAWIIIPRNPRHSWK